MNAPPWPPPGGSPTGGLVEKASLLEQKPDTGPFHRTRQQLGEQAWDSGAADQRGQAGSEDDTTELPSLPIQRGAAVAEFDRLQPGEPVAAAGAPKEDRSLVPNQLAATAGGRLVTECSGQTL